MSASDPKPCRAGRLLRIVAGGVLLLWRGSVSTSVVARTRVSRHIQTDSRRSNCARDGPGGRGRSDGRAAEDGLAGWTGGGGGGGVGRRGIGRSGRKLQIIITRTGPRFIGPGRVGDGARVGGACRSGRWSMESGEGIGIRIRMSGLFDGGAADHDLESSGPHR